MIFCQNKKNIYIFILFKSVHAPALNAWFFESSVIVENESLSCPRCEKMDLKIIVIVGTGSNTQKCWKTKEFVGAEGFF